MSQHFVVILAGGKGERFWPLSRQARPKQLLPIVGDKPMLAQTLSRVGRVVPRKNILIITNAAQAAAVRRVCPGLPERNIIAEPVGRDSGPAVGLAAALVERVDPRGVFAILAADHVIHDEAAFRRDLKAAFAAAEASPVMVTIGIVPTEPVTGYGYIKTAKKRTKAGAGRIQPVERFVEKPDLKTAKGYLASGDYFWNAGMFVWTVDALRESLRVHAPELFCFCSGLIEAGNVEAFLEEGFGRVPKLSFDYAVMEKLAGALAVEAEFGWDDLGGWVAAGKYYEKDDRGNAANIRLQTVDSSGNIVFSSDKNQVVALVGVANLVVVNTGDALLVCAKEQAERIKELVGGLPEELR